MKTLERVRHRVSGYVAVGQNQYVTIADLDEAIFPLARLLNFTATIVRADKDRLNLDVNVSEGREDDIVSEVDRALKSIPALRLARAAGAVEVTVAVRVQDSSVASPIKRTITALT